MRPTSVGLLLLCACGAPPAPASAPPPTTPAGPTDAGVATAVDPADASITVDAATPRDRVREPPLPPSPLPPPIAKVVDGARPLVVDCFEREHAKDASLRGTFDLFFVLGAQGNVMHAVPRYVDGLNDAVVSCAADVVMKLTFPVKPLEPVGYGVRFTFGEAPLR